VLVAMDVTSQAEDENHVPIMTRARASLMAGMKTCRQGRREGGSGSVVGIGSAMTYPTG
jgi:hypothetical protein